MAKTTDWLPSSRQEQLSMAQNWIKILQGTGAKKWGVPADTLTEFGAQTNAAAAAFAAAKNEETKTSVTTAQCKQAFDVLTAAMRNIKKRWFFVPPLTDADIISLGLKPRDTNPTPSGAPTGQAGIETYLIGRHQLGVKITLLTGKPDDPANKGWRIWYSLTSHGETPPANPEELNKSFFTKKKKDVIDFEFGDSGKRAWLAAQIENEGKKGPWGPMISAVVP